mgnify:CR=1 FL=1
MSKVVSLISVLFFSMTLSAAQAADVSVTEKTDIAASPASVWAASKNFNDIAGWHPAIISQTTTDDNQPGSVRVANLGGPTITEELVRFNDEHKNFTYKITQVDPAVLPVENYLSWFSVSANNHGGSTVTWMGNFNLVGDAKASDIEKGVRGIYRAGLDSLKATLEAGIQ